MRDVWSPLLPEGRLVLLSGDRGDLRGFHHELAHHAVHRRKGPFLWCDGEHGFNPYTFAELNLTRGFQADAEADRLLIKRCMTPFQWDTVLTQHLEKKLLEVGASAVLAAPYDALFSTDELKDWEQEDYVAYSLRYLKDLARARNVPILLSVDMARWWRTHPTLARQALEAVSERWNVGRKAGAWWAARHGSNEILQQPVPQRVTLLDFLPELEAVVRSPSRTRATRDPAAPLRVSR